MYCLHLRVLIINLSYQAKDDITAEVSDPFPASVHATYLVVQLATVEKNLTQSTSDLATAKERIATLEANIAMNKESAKVEKAKQTAEKAELQSYVDVLTDSCASWRKSFESEQKAKKEVESDLAKKEVALKSKEAIVSQFGFLMSVLLTRFPECLAHRRSENA